MLHLFSLSVSLQWNMIMCVRELLIVLLSGVTGNLIYNERIAGDNCTCIHNCRFEIVPARSLVECGVKVIHADSGLLFYDETEETCSVCHPTPPNVYQLARGQMFYAGGTYSLCALSAIFKTIFTVPFVITNINKIYIQHDGNCLTQSFGSMINRPALEHIKQKVLSQRRDYFLSILMNAQTFSMITCSRLCFTPIHGSSFSLH